jgi:dynein heavy chain
MERMLVYINDMLSSGYIAGLFPNEDVQAMAGNLRQEAKGEGIVETPGNLLNFWLEKLKANMHTILCFSPVGDPFRIRARKFPGLISCAMIDYFHAWPPEALNSVALRYLKETKFASDELRDLVALDMADVHISIKQIAKKYLEVERRYVFTTPKSFLEFKDYYNLLLKEKRTFIFNKINRLEKGLEII